MLAGSTPRSAARWRRKELIAVVALAWVRKRVSKNVSAGRSAVRINRFGRSSTEPPWPSRSHQSITNGALVRRRAASAGKITLGRHSKAWIRSIWAIRSQAARARQAHGSQPERRLPGSRSGASTSARRLCCSYATRKRARSCGAVAIMVAWCPRRHSSRAI